MCAILPRDHPGHMEHVRWRKSSFSGYLECVELAHSLREVRDSKNPTGPVLTVDLDELLAAVKRGDLDAATGRTSQEIAAASGTTQGHP